MRSGGKSTNCANWTNGGSAHDAAVPNPFLSILQSCPKSVDEQCSCRIDDAEQLTGLPDDQDWTPLGDHASRVSFVSFVCFCSKRRNEWEVVTADDADLAQIDNGSQNPACKYHGTEFTILRQKHYRRKNVTVGIFLSIRRHLWFILLVAIDPHSIGV
jgi:hypothetical protein